MQRLPQKFKVEWLSVWQTSQTLYHTHLHVFKFKIHEIILEKWFPSQGEQEFLKLQSQSKLNPNQSNPFFLFFLTVSLANLSCVVATIFSSLAFLSSSVSMANLSRLVATSLTFFSWSIYMAKLSRFVAASLVTTFSSLSFLSNSFSSPRFMARRCFS